MASLVGSVPLMAGGRLAPRGGTRGSTRHWAAAARVGSIGEEHTSAPAFAAVVGRRRVQKQQQPRGGGGGGGQQQLCVAAASHTSSSSLSSRLGGGGGDHHQRGRRAMVVAAAGAKGGASGDDENKVVDEPVIGKSSFDFEAEMQADMERLAADSPLAKEAAAAAEAGTAVKSESTQKMEAIKDGIDTFLLYDFFVILFILAYLVVGVLIRLSYHGGLAYDEPVLGLWLVLWPVLFQPLLGVHMLATIVSPIIGKLKDANLVSKDTWT